MNRYYVSYKFLHFNSTRKLYFKNFLVKEWMSNKYCYFDWIIIFIISRNVLLILDVHWTLTDSLYSFINLWNYWKFKDTKFSYSLYCWLFKVMLSTFTASNVLLVIIVEEIIRTCPSRSSIWERNFRICFRCWEANRRWTAKSDPDPIPDPV